jgi:hypothetical protein
MVYTQAHTHSRKSHMTYTTDMQVLEQKKGGHQHWVMSREDECRQDFPSKIMRASLMARGS